MNRRTQFAVLHQSRLEALESCSGPCKYPPSSCAGLISTTWPSLSCLVQAICIPETTCSYTTYLTHIAYIPRPSKPAGVKTTSSLLDTLAPIVTLSSALCSVACDESPLGPKAIFDCTIQDNCTCYPRSVILTPRDASDAAPCDIHPDNNSPGHQKELHNGRPAHHALCPGTAAALPPFYARQQTPPCAQPLAILPAASRASAVAKQRQRLPRAAPCRLDTAIAKGPPCPPAVHARGTASQQRVPITALDQVTIGRLQLRLGL